MYIAVESLFRLYKTIADTQIYLFDFLLDFESWSCSVYFFIF